MTTQRYERIPEFTAGDRLRKARESAGLDQAGIAAATGISRGTVSHLELDKAPLKRSYLQLWAMATGVPVEWLERGDASQPTPPGDAAPTRDSDALAELTRRKQARTRRGATPTRAYVAAAA